MQINKLRLVNYKQYRNAEIIFPEGLTGFIGSNGSGKSTILEAIAYALYGKCSSAKEDIRNDNANGKDIVEAEVVLNDKGKEYIIRRQLKGKNLSAGAELYCDGIQIASQSTEVNKHIIKLLKIDYRNFKRSYFSEQKDVTALLTMKTGERQVEIRKMLGLEKLDKLEDRVRDHTKEMKLKISLRKEQLLSDEQIDEIENQKTQLQLKELTSAEERDKLNTELQKAKRDYQEIKKKVSDYELLKDKHERLGKDLSVTRSRIIGTDKQITSACGELSSLNQHRQKLTELLPLKEKYEVINQELLGMLNEEARFTRKSGLLSDIKDRSQFIQERSQQLKSKENEIARILPAEYELKEKLLLMELKENLIKAKNENRDSVKEIISASENQLKQKQKRLNEIKKLGKDSPCPECERPLKEHYNKLVEEYVIQINELNQLLECKKSDLSGVESEISNYRSEKNNLSDSIKEMEFRLNKISLLKKDIEQITLEIRKAEAKIKTTEEEIETIGNVSFDAERLKLLKDEEKNNQPFYTKFAELSVEIKRIPVVEEKLNVLRTEKNLLTANESEITDQIRVNGYNDEEYISLKENCHIREHLKDDLQIKFFTVEAELKELSVRLNSLTENINKDKTLREELKKSEEEISVYERLCSFINIFKQRIASQELPAISLEASRLFSGITRDRYSDLVIDKDYEIYVNREANKVLLNTLSGGEKDLAGLCLRIAISKRIAALAGRENMGFLALDEVFGSQDESRREELMSALYRISNDFRQIFVISHNEDVKEAFPNRLFVRKEGKYSIVDSY